MIESNASSASFRDPSGFVFEQDGVIYRQINKGFRGDIDLLLQSGLHAQLVDAELVVDFQEVGLNLAASPQAEMVIRPTRLDFISYPQEWSFSQLKDAALLTLEIMRRSLESGMVLKDASAFNVQFVGSKPIFIDTLSFERYVEGGPWIAYKQFCQHFLAPLALMALVNIRLGSLFQTNLDGVPLDLASKLLPLKTKFSPGITAHIHLHAKAQGSNSSSAKPAREATISKTSLLALVDSLRSTISGLQWKPEGTEWADYYNDTNYSAQALSDKASIVQSFLTKLPETSATCCDLGANNGEFSLLAVNRGLKTIAMDIDPAAVESCYLRAKQRNPELLMPLLQDLRNPTPNFGWSSNERESMMARSSFDVLLALALIHHLAIGNNVPLPKVAEFFSQLGSWLIIEFVPKEDSQVQRMLVARKDIFDLYDKDNFENAFNSHFTICREATSRRNVPHNISDAKEQIVSEAESNAPPPKSPFIVYPILFSIFPVLAIYSANLAIIPLSMVLRPIGIVTGSVLALWVLFSLILRSVGRGAVASSVLVAMTFLYTKVQKLTWSLFVPHEFEFWVWLALTVLVGGVMAWKFNKHKLANFLSVALVVTSSAQIGFGLAKSAQLRPKEVDMGGHSRTASTSRPDIYYVILDGYGRSDALQRALKYDNHSFIEGLESRGFYVAQDAHANYCQTELSVGSSLNFDTIQTLLSKPALQSNDRAPLGEIINHNAAAKYLRDKGYIFAAITTGFPPLQFESADVNMRSKVGMTMIESALIQLTPMGSLSQTLESMHFRRREDINLAFESFSRLRSKIGTPRFVVVHILAPHPPFVFGPDGQVVNQRGAFGFWDGSDYIEHVSSAANYQTGYTGQATYIGKQMLDALDKVLNTDGEKPLILIQGDHGSKMRLDQVSLARTDVNECFPNLSAYFVPDSVRKNLYPSITPINSFRVVFNGLFNDNLPLKEDKSWYSTFPQPFNFTEVTGQIADHTKLPSIPLP